MIRQSPGTSEWPVSAFRRRSVIQALTDSDGHHLHRRAGCSAPAWPGRGGRWLRPGSKDRGPPWFPMRDDRPGMLQWPPLLRRSPVPEMAGAEATRTRPTPTSSASWLSSSAGTSGLCHRPTGCSPLGAALDVGHAGLRAGTEPSDFGTVGLEDQSELRVGSIRRHEGEIGTGSNILVR